MLLDGEIVALDAQGRPAFARLTQRMHVRAPERGAGRAVAGAAVRVRRAAVGPPYDERRAALEALDLGAVPHLAVPPAYDDVSAAQLLEVARAHGLEGVVAKRRRSRYEPGRRSAAWVKTALTTTQEVVVGGWSPGQGRRSGMVGSVHMGAYDRAGRLRYLGMVGTGFTDAALRQLAERLAPLAVAASPFDDEVPAPDARAARWVRPELVGEVVYRVLTPGPAAAAHGLAGPAPRPRPGRDRAGPAVAAADLTGRASAGKIGANRTSWTVATGVRCRLDAIIGGGQRLPVAHLVHRDAEDPVGRSVPSGRQPPAS